MYKKPVVNNGRSTTFPSTGEFFSGFLVIPSMPGMHIGEAKDLVVHVAGGELPRQGGITLLPGKKKYQDQNSEKISTGDYRQKLVLYG